MTAHSVLQQDSANQNSNFLSFLKSTKSDTSQKIYVKAKDQKEGRKTLLLHLSGCLEPGENESMEEEKAETAIY